MGQAEVKHPIAISWCSGGSRTVFHEIVTRCYFFEHRCEQVENVELRELDPPLFIYFIYLFIHTNTNREYPT